SEFEGWWYEGGGIYRHVRLVSLSPTHVAPWGVHIVSNVKDPRDGIQADARLEVTTTVANDHGAAAYAILLTEVLDPNGLPITAERTTHSMPTNSTFEFKQSLALPKANLWSCEHPSLYRLRTTVFVSPQSSAAWAGKPNREAQKLVDQLNTDFGVR